MQLTAIISGGRPCRAETRRRTRDLLALVAAGRPLRQAAREAGVKPDRVLRLLDDDTFFSAYRALRETAPAEVAA